MGTVNDNIRNFRKFRQMSQKRLGEALNKSTNVVSNWENGIHSPDLDTIEQLCKVLNVTPNQIFGWEENPEYRLHQEKLKDIQHKIDKLEHERRKLSDEIHALETQKFQMEPPFTFENDDILGDRPMPKPPIRRRLDNES